MKKRRIPAGRLLPGLCAVLVLAFMQVCAADGAQATVIETKVPDSHTVTLVMEGKGTVGADGKTYSGTQEIQVGRLEEQAYTITAADGWEVERVTYGKAGSETEAALTDGVFTAPAVYEDGNRLTAVFVKDTFGTDTKPGGSGTSGTGSKPGAGGSSGGQAASGQGAKTGDESQPALWLFAAVLSLAALVLGTAVRRKRIH